MRRKSFFRREVYSCKISALTTNLVVFAFGEIDVDYLKGTRRIAMQSCFAKFAHTIETDKPPIYIAIPRKKTRIKYVYSV